MNILFVCSRNKKRSLTAETIFHNNNEHYFTSGGTEENARVKISPGMIQRADIIFVMEKVHKEKLAYQFNDLISNKKIIVLNIPDEYEYMDEDLVKMLKDEIRAHLGIK